MQQQIAKISKSRKCYASASYTVKLKQMISSTTDSDENQMSIFTDESTVTADVSDVVFLYILLDSV